MVIVSYPIIFNDRRKECLPIDPEKPPQMHSVKKRIAAAINGARDEYVVFNCRCDLKIVICKAPSNVTSNDRKQNDEE